MTPEDEIQDRMRRLHDWAEHRPHSLVAPTLPRRQTRPPEIRRHQWAAYVAAAAVVLIAVTGHSLGFRASDLELLGRPAADSAAPVRSVASPATSTAPTTPLTEGTPPPALPSPPSESPAPPSTTVVTMAGPLPTPKRSSTASPPAAVPPAVGTVIGLESLAVPGSLVQRDNLDLRIGPVRTPTSGTDAAASSFLVRPGLAGPTGLSFESVELPGYFVSVSGDRAVLLPRSSTAAFENNATFLASGSPTGQGLSFASFARRTSSLRVVGDALYARPDGASTARAGAAFVVRKGLYTQPVNRVRTEGSIVTPGSRCLDIWGSDVGGEGAPVGLYDCLASAADQQFSHELDFSLRTLGRCVDVVGADIGTVGAEVVLWTCSSGATDQRWIHAPDGSLRSQASGLCLQSVGGATVNGTRMELGRCTGGPEQQFRLLG